MDPAELLKMKNVIRNNHIFLRDENIKKVYEYTESLIAKPATGAKLACCDGLRLPVYYYRCPECKHEWQENKDLSECPKCLRETLRNIEDQKSRGVERPSRRPILFDGQRELRHDSPYMRRQA